NGRNRRQVQNLFVPPETFGRMPPYRPKDRQPRRDVGRFDSATALDQPAQRGGVTLEISTHTIQPFNLRRSDQPLRGERGLTEAIAHQSVTCIVALTGGSKLERGERPHRFEHLVSGRVATEVSARSRRLLSINPATPR